MMVILEYSMDLPIMSSYSVPKCPSFSLYFILPSPLPMLSETKLAACVPTSRPVYVPSCLPMLAIFSACHLCSGVTVRSHVAAGLESDSGIRVFMFPSGQSPA